MSNKALVICLAVVVVIAIGIKLNDKNAASNSYASATSVTDQVSISAAPNPVRMGPAVFTINVKDDKGAPVSNAAVSFDINMTTMNMGAQQGTAISQGDGSYVANGRLTMQGHWRLAATVTMPDGKVINKSFDVNVQ